MATSTLVQYLGSTNTSSTDVAATEVNRRQVETFIAGTTVALGQWVALDLTKSPSPSTTVIDDYAEAALFVRPAASDLNAAATIESQASIVVGVVLSSAEPGQTLTAGSKINVVTRGIAIAQVDAAGAKTDILIGMALQPDVTATAGRAIAQAAASTARACGIALASATTQTAIPVYVLPSMT